MDRPNVIWITLDTLRSDHTSIDGYERDTTPSMARLGEQGDAFSTCISHGKSTLPSSGAILTGYAPTRTRVGIDGNALPEGTTTIPERFAANGYATACLSRNSYVSSETGLDRGFERFQWLASSTIHEAGVGTLLKYLLNIRSHSAGFTLDTAKHASPLLMNEVAKQWLGDFEGDREPFFFYLHYNEPHRPYYPPNSYLDRYTDDIEMSPREAAEFALDVHYNMDEVIANGCAFTSEEWAALRAMYDAEIAYTDDMVGRLIEYVRSLDLGETVVVVTGDHGELFGEHGLLSHGYVLTDAVTRVPLVIDGLIDDLAVTDDDLIQHSDVMTTLLEAAGIDADDTIGVDLRETGREFAVSQRGPVEFDHFLTHNPEFDSSRFHEETLTALRTTEYRYQKSEDAVTLYDLDDEQRDVSEEVPAVATDLEDRLDAWLDDHGRPATDGERVDFSAAAENQLRDLGYLD